MYSKKIGKPVNDISSEALKKLLLYDWPGNIRELENLIERAVLLAPGNIITDIVLPEQKNPIISSTGLKGTIKTIEENERDHIIAALRSCSGKISGEGGAAELLNIHVSTLNSKIKKLGIKREHYFTVEKNA